MKKQTINRLHLRKFDKAEIQEKLLIKDFSSWLTKDNMSEEQAFLVLLGIDPEYYLNYLSNRDRVVVDEFSIIPFSKYMSYERLFYFAYDKNDKKTGYLWFSENKNRFIKSLKTKIKWNQSWKRFIDDIYCSGLIINEHFFQSCADFMLDPHVKKLINNRFDHYLKFDQYRPNYDDYFDRQKDLILDEVACLLIGVDPIFFIRHDTYESLENRKGKLLEELRQEGWEFFCESYYLFLRHNNICPTDVDKIFKRNLPYTGNLENYICDLYNEGFIFDEYLTNYLTSKNMMPKYDKDSSIYMVFDLFSKAQYWTLEDIINILKGHNPFSKKQLLQFLGNSDIQSSIQYKLSWVELTDAEVQEGKTIYKILLKSGDICRAEIIDQFCQKKGNGYDPKDVVKWLVDNTYIVLSDTLIEKLFPNKNQQNRLKEGNLLNKIKRGRQEVIDWNAVWKILIEDILGGKVQNNNTPLHKQAADVYSTLSQQKLRSLNFENNKRVIMANVVLAFRENNKITVTPQRSEDKNLVYTSLKVGQSSLEKRLIKPFIQELLQ